MPSSEIVVRPSSLSDAADCMRRFAARHLQDLLASAGYTLRRRPPSVHIGAAVGTGMHTFAHTTIAPRLAGEPLAPVAVAEEQAIAAFRAETDGSVEWDNITGTANDAEKQIRRMGKAWRRVRAEEIVPVQIEERIEADAADGIVLSGQPDLVEDRGAFMRLTDMKSNKVRRSPHLQLGAYALLLRSIDMPVGEIAMDHIPRVKLSDAQPDPTLVQMDLRAAIEDAHTALQNIERCVTEFEKRAANPRGLSPISAFPPNPGSMLCNERFCPAWGTDACRAHLNT